LYKLGPVKNLYQVLTEYMLIKQEASPCCGVPGIQTRKRQLNYRMETPGKTWHHIRSRKKPFPKVLLLLLLM
jgi:hypothetical protein